MEAEKIEVVDKTAVEHPVENYISPDVAAAMAGQKVEMGKELPDGSSKS